jgi:hypothetical protein
LRAVTEKAIVVSLFYATCRCETAAMTTAQRQL